MVSRLSTIISFVTASFLGVFFIFPPLAQASEASETHVRFADAIVTFYNYTADERLLAPEREQIAWGVGHEGIPARVLRHGDTAWPHDSITQSYRIYEGVYTWEQGIYDYARGDTAHAYETLGHLLHLTIDAHPLAQTFPIDEDFPATLRRSAKGTFVSSQSWREMIDRAAREDAERLVREGAALLTRFFAEAKLTAPSQPRPLTRDNLSSIMVRRAVAAVRSSFNRVVNATIGTARSFARAVGNVFSRAPSIAFGGTPSRAVPPASAEAAEAPPLLQEDIPAPQKQNVRSFPFTASIAAPSHELPLAQSIAVVAPEDAPPIAEPVKETEQPAPFISAPPLFIPPLSLPPALPDIPTTDYLGFPHGFVHRTRDTIAPETTILESPSAMSNDAAATFVFSATEGGTFFCTLDGGEETQCASPVAYENLLEGQHTFAVRAKDGAGNFDETPASHAWTIDRTPPDAAITQSPPVLTNNVISTFLFTASEGGAMFGYALDGGAWQPATSPLTFTSLLDGEHTVTIRAQDAAGNIDPTLLTHTWIVDTIAPSPPVLTSPTTDVVYTTVLSSLVLSGTRESGATITVNDASDGVTTPTATTWQKTVMLALGATTFTLRAIDAAGNVSAPFILTITRTENQIPGAITNLAVTTPVFTHDRVTLTWTAPQDPDSALSNLIYDLRYAITPITNEATWETATAAEAEPLVAAAGTAQTMIVTGLSGHTRYYFALRMRDEESLSPLSNAVDATTVWGGTVTQATTWAIADSPVVVGGDLTIANLTIDPDVVIKFASGADIIVTTSLSSVGTQAQPIIFTSLRDDTAAGDTNGDGGATTPAAGDWGAIALATGAGGTMEYSEVWYGGSETGAVFIASATMTIRSATVTQNTRGIALSGAGATLTLAMVNSSANALYNLWNDPTNSGTVNWVQITLVQFQGGVNDEYVVIKNEGTGARDLAGWKLHDAAATPNTYTFGAFTLAAGATVTVHTGAGTNTATDLYWGRGVSVWNDSGDTAYFKDNAGTLLDKVSW